MRKGCEKGRISLVPLWDYFDFSMIHMCEIEHSYNNIFWVEWGGENGNDIINSEIMPSFVAYKLYKPAFNWKNWLWYEEVIMSSEQLEGELLMVVIFKITKTSSWMGKWYLTNLQCHHKSKLK